MNSELARALAGSTFSILSTPSNQTSWRGCWIMPTSRECQLRARSARENRSRSLSSGRSSSRQCLTSPVSAQPHTFSFRFHFNRKTGQDLGSPEGKIETSPMRPQTQEGRDAGDLCSVQGVEAEAPSIGLSARTLPVTAYSERRAADRYHQWHPISLRGSQRQRK